MLSSDVTTASIQVNQTVRIRLGETLDTVRLFPNPLRHPYPE